MTRQYKYPSKLFYYSFVILALIFAATQIGPILEDRKIRQSVIRALDDSDAAKALVVRNFSLSLPLDSNWDFDLSNDYDISIEPEEGIITITFAKHIDGGGKTLKLYPSFQLFKNKTGDITLGDLQELKKFKLTGARGRTTWVCTSSLSTGDNTKINRQVGTLNSRFVPLSCRSHIKQSTS